MKKILLTIFISILLVSSVYASGNRWTSKPPVGSQIDWSHPLSKGLAFVSILNEKGGKPIELLTKTPANVRDGIWSPNGIDCSAITTTQKGASWDLSNIKSSTGNGLGDYTILVCANPISEDTKRALFSQKNDALGSPYTQTWFAVNADASDNSSQNKISMNIYSGAGYGAYGNYTFDGNFHTFVGLRKNALFSIYVDLQNLSLTTNYVEGNRTMWKVGLKTAIGSMAGTYTGTQFNRTIKYAYAWNRDLTPTEIKKLYEDPYCFIQPPTVWSKFKQAVGGAYSGWVSIIND
jgi:hypothetical protein